MNVRVVVEKRTVVDEYSTGAKNIVYDLEKFDDVVCAIDEEATAHAIPGFVLRCVAVDLNEVSRDHVHLTLRRVLICADVREAAALQRVISFEVVDELVTVWVDLELIVHQAAVQDEVRGDQHEQREFVAFTEETANCDFINESSKARAWHQLKETCS